MADVPSKLPQPTRAAKFWPGGLTLIVPAAPRVPKILTAGGDSVAEVPSNTRTFSKIHGLAGLRIGYSISSAAVAKRLADLALVWPNTTGIDAALADGTQLSLGEATIDASGALVLRTPDATLAIPAAEVFF